MANGDEQHICVSHTSLFFPPSLPPFLPQVLRTVCEWVCPSLASSSSSSSSTPPSLPSSSSSPILLVHGVFGSGKSHLLVALCLLLDRFSYLLLLRKEGGGEEEEEEEVGGMMGGWRRREERGGGEGRAGGREGGRGELRVMIASSTNVAVDNILVQLVQRGYVLLLSLPPSLPPSLRLHLQPLPPSLPPSLRTQLHQANARGLSSITPPPRPLHDTASNSDPSLPPSFPLLTMRVLTTSPSLPPSLPPHPATPS